MRFPDAAALYDGGVTAPPRRSKLEESAERGPCRKIKAGGGESARRAACLSGRRKRASAKAAGLASAFSVAPGPVDHRNRRRGGDRPPVPPKMELPQIVGAHEPNKFHPGRSRAQKSDAVAGIA